MWCNMICSNGNGDAPILMVSSFFSQLYLYVTLNAFLLCKSFKQLNQQQTYIGSYCVPEIIIGAFSVFFKIFTVNLRCRHHHHDHHHYCHHHRHHHHHYRSHLINEEADAQTGKCCCQRWHQNSNPG